MSFISTLLYIKCSKGAESNECKIRVLRPPMISFFYQKNQMIETVFTFKRSETKRLEFKKYLRQPNNTTENSSRNHFRFYGFVFL